MKTWTFEGCLNSGDSVLSSRANRDLAIEREWYYLTDPTPEERAEIYGKFPHLKPASMD